MTKKHFIAIAATIRNELSIAPTTDHEAAIEATAYALAATFQRFNPRFDWGRFLAACGVDNV